MYEILPDFVHTTPAGSGRGMTGGSCLDLMMSVSVDSHLVCFPAPAGWILVEVYLLTHTQRHSRLLWEAHQEESPDGIETL